MGKNKWLLFAGLFLLGLGFYFRNQFQAPISKENSNEPAEVSESSAQPTAQNRKPAQTGNVGQKNLDPLQKFLQSKDPQATWNVQTHSDGRPSHILGGRIRMNGGSDSLTVLLKEISPYLGVRADDLRLQTESDRSEVSNSSQMTQYYGRYRVYGASLKAFSNPNTQEVYHIVSDLRALEQVDTRVNVGRDEAGEIARKTMGNAEINIIKISQEPVVFGTSPTNNQLVWRVFLTSERPRYQSREILVSTQNGSVVQNQTMLKH